MKLPLGYLGTDLRLARRTNPLGSRDFEVQSLAASVEKCKISLSYVPLVCLLAASSALGRSHVREGHKTSSGLMITVSEPVARETA